MDKLENYRQIITQIIQRHAAVPSGDEQVESEAICDEKTDNYLLVDLGWYPNSRLHSFPIHVRIKDEKFWIEWDGTEYGVAQELLDAGVPKEDIVLAFYTPEHRRNITDLAAA